MEPPRRPRAKGHAPRSEEETSDDSVTPEGRERDKARDRTPPAEDRPRARSSERLVKPPAAKSDPPSETSRRPTAPFPRREIERRARESEAAGSPHPEITRALDERRASGRPHVPSDPNAETQPLPLAPRRTRESGSDVGRADRPRPSARGLSPEAAEEDLRREIARRVRFHAPTGTGPADQARLSHLLEINKALNRDELGRLLDMIMDAAIGLSHARRGFLVTWDRGEARVVRARNIARESIDSPDAAISRHLLREAIDRRETVVVAEAALERSGYASVQGLDLKSVLVSPLISRGRIVGAIYLDDPERTGIFQAEDVVAMVEAFCDQAAIALANAYKLEEAQNRFESSRFKLQRIEAEVRRHDEEDVRRFGNVVGKSPAMRKVFDLLARVTDTSFPVVITGESGTGKELIAKAIHFSGPRKEAPFVATSCAAVPETLLDSEFFGYTAGAFTGANRDRKGLFEQAHGGTLFLDEIEEMSPAMQGKLLRVLQEGEIRRVGAKETITINVRILCATNRDLKVLVERGEFRRDLYYRLNVIPVLIPPLRERPEDVPALVSDLMARLGAGAEGPLEIARDALEALTRYPWPGNVRELENELKRVAALGVRRIGLGDLAARIVAPASGDRAPAGTGARADASANSELPTLNLRRMERLAIERALADSGGNKTQAAKVLGLSRRGLLKKLERYRTGDAELEEGASTDGAADDGD